MAGIDEILKRDSNNEPVIGLVTDDANANIRMGRIDDTTKGLKVMIVGGNTGNITGLITAGTNVTIGGSGTTASPYIINASSGGAGNPGGSTTQIQYNNAGTAFGGITNVLTDGTNLGIGTAVPTSGITLATTFNQDFYNTTDQITNFERARLEWTSNVFTILTQNGGTGTVRNVQLNGNGSAITIGTSLGTATGTTALINRQSTSQTTLLEASYGTSSTGAIGSSGFQNSIMVGTTVSQTGTAGHRALFLTPFLSATGSGTQYLIDGGTNTANGGSGTHTSVFTVGTSGIMYLASRLSIGNSTTQPTQLSVSGGFATGAAFGTTGFGLNVGAQTYTSTASSGTIATVGLNTIGIPTLVSSSATTFTAASTLYLAGAPVASTNVTITNALALDVHSGAIGLAGSPGTNGQVLTSGGTGATPTWTTVSGGSPSIGGTITSGTNGSVLFVNPSSTIAQNNANFYVNNSGAPGANNTQIAVNINTNGDQTGDNAINYYGQATSFLFNSQITNTVAGYATDGAIPGLLLSSLRGNLATPQPLQAGDTVGGITYQIIGGTTGSLTFPAGAAILGFADGVTTTNLGGAIGFYNKLDNGTLSQSMFLNNAGKLGFGTNAPTDTLTFAMGGTEALYNTVDQITNYERMKMSWVSNIFTMTTQNGGTGISRGVSIIGGGNLLTLGTTAVNQGVIEARRDGTGVNTIFGVGSTGFTSSSAMQTPIALYPTVTQTGTAGFRGLWITPFINTTGSGNYYLIDAGTNTAANASGTYTSKFTVDSNGLTVALGGINTGASFSSNFYAIATGGAAGGITSAQLLFGGASTIALRNLFGGTTSTVLGTGVNYSNVIVAASPITTGATGTNTWVNNFTINALGTVTNGAGGAPTNTATLYIGGASTAGTNNYAINVVSGITQLSGAVLYGINPVTAAANAATVPVTSRLTTITNNAAAAITITITTTGATDGQLIMVRFYDFSAASQTITWTNTENSLVSVPTASNGSTTLPLTIGFQYNGLTSKWRCIASA